MGSIRLVVLKVAAVVVPLGLVVAAMHFLLPGCARRRLHGQLGEDYVLTETPRLRIYVPRDKRLAPLVSEGVERFAGALYAEYGEALSLRPLREKITILLFASQEELVEFAGETMHQDLSHASGFYDPVKWRIALTLRPPRELLALIFHETTHLLMDLSATLGDPQWSLWVAEGMAVFFEHSSVERGGIRLGGVSARDLALVVGLAREGRHIPLRRLVRAGPRGFHSSEGPLYYGEAGLLVAYLLTGAGGERREAFLRYYQRERRPGPVPPNALETYLRVPIDQLEEQWLQYLERQWLQHQQRIAR